MATLIIVHDTQREIAVFVDAETQQGYGPAVIGPDAADLLQEFTDAMPFDLGGLSAEVITTLFRDYGEHMAATVPATAPTAPISPVEPPGDAGVADGAKLADATAAAASDVPAEQPADVDPEAASSAPVTIVACHACQGDGKLDLGDGQGLVTCNMCQGTGQIAVRA